MSKIQSVLFDVKKWDTRKAKKWLTEHNYKPIKRAHVTETYIRFRIQEPDQTKKYRNIIFGKGIRAIIEF